MLPSPHAPGSSAFGSSRFALLLALIALVLAIPVSASEYTVYLDSDDDASTGCTVSTVDGDFFGAESATTTTVDDMTLEVTSVEMAMCNGGAFDPPVTLADFVTPWNVGLDAGVSGAEVVESYVPFADVRTACVRAAITSDDGSGGLDAILNTTGLPGGSEIRFGNCGSIVEIPTADSVGLTILALLLAIAAGLALRRHPTALVWIVFVISASAALVGVVQAAPGNVFFLDGDPTEWLGNTQFQVGDPAGDVGSNADLIAAFFGYSVDDQTLFVRFDYSGPSAPPTAVDDVATVAEDAAATTIDVQANDTDPDGGPNSVLSVTQPADGTVVITNSGADLTYQPDPDYCNDGTPTDDFTYTLNGGSSATVAVTVTCIDDPPTAVDDTATVAEDAAATAIDVLMNDTDADGGTILVQSVTQPTDGTVVITGGGIGLTYQPDADFCNDGTPTDDFTYTLNGGSTATVAVTVTCDDDPPTAVDDTATVLEDAAATAIDVLMNDTDADGGTILVQSVTQPTDGTVVITGGGTGLTYQPDADFCNDGTPTDDFTYTLNGGSTATVAVTVTCVNDEPVFTAGADETVAEDAGAQTVNGWATGIDDGDAEATQMLTFTVTNDDNALFSQQPDVDETTGDLTYTSAMGASGSATVSVFLMDDGGTANSGDDTSPTQMFTITVTDVDNPPTCTTTAGITAFTEDGGAVAVDSGITVADSDSANLVSATVTITNLLDAGLENLAASVGGTSIVANYVAPTLSLTGSDTLANYQAVLQSLTYNNSSNDPDETSRIISCVVNDGTTASAAANKTVSVAEVNDPPTVTSPTIDYNVVGNTLLRVDSADADNHDMGLPERVASTTSLIEALAAAGASDPDSPAPVFVAEVAETTDQGGLLTLDDDGDLHYLPPIGFTGTDTESVVITDGEGGNVPVTLRFTVAEMIWYVEDTIGAKNPAGNADGRSTDAFQTLAAVEAASGAGDTILLFETDAPLNETITLKSGQKFYGQRVEEEPISLLPTGLLLEEIADTNARPQVRRTGGVAVNVTSAGGAMANVEIRHLDLDSGDTDAIEVNISGANPVTNLLIDENIIGSDGARGIDLNSAPTSGQSSVSISDNQVDVLTDGIDVDHTTAGSLVLTIDGNQILRAGARGISVSETAGTVTVVSLDGNSVAGGSGGDGMVFEGVTFDADESTPAYEMVDANNTTIGSAGNGVGGMGLVISNGSGDLLFDDLDI
ncbi:MAG: Ig-like domain-containing protein, partial [Acidobacteriota bacterium]